MRLRAPPTLLTGHQDTDEKPDRFIRVMSVDRHLQVSICLLHWHACAWCSACHAAPAAEDQPTRSVKHGRKQAECLPPYSTAPTLQLTG